MKLITIVLSLFISGFAYAGHHEEGEAKARTIIGSYITDTGKVNQMFAGDISRQQIWMDYIEAHNDRDLQKIGAINTSD